MRSTKRTKLGTILKNDVNKYMFIVMWLLMGEHTCRVAFFKVKLQAHDLHVLIYFGFAEGYSGVVEPSECIHISEKAKTIAKVWFLVYKYPSPRSFNVLSCTLPCCNISIILLFWIMQGNLLAFTMGTLGITSLLYLPPDSLGSFSNATPTATRTSTNQ